MADQLDGLRMGQRQRALLLVLPWLLTGCFNMFSVRVAKDAQDREPLAHVSGDYHVRAGAEVNVFLRSVDDVPLKFWQHAADIDAGEHRLLVDCTVVSTQKLSRHELVVTLEPGAKYQLVAEATPHQGCTQVSLQETH